MKRLLAALAALGCLIARPALAEDWAESAEDAVYTLQNEAGAPLTQIGVRVYEGDEYIGGDDTAYRVIAVDAPARTATARPVQGEGTPGEAQTAFASLIARAEKSKRVGMYSTHSDESYQPSDGAYSLEKNAGIYDVGEALKDALEAKGIQVEYSRETFLPHDAGAYRRSRATVEELLKDAPDALFDIHRDAIAAEQYETEIDGEDASKVRLFVGRSNPNAAANRSFAREIKAAADEKYPGLIKDIFIGRGNYNQELSSKALLLEFGTHEIDKGRAIAATKYMADVIDEVLYGGSASASTGRGVKGRDAAKGIGWTVGLALLAAAVYALASTGTMKGAWRRLRRGASQVTGGLLGERPEEDGKK